VAILSCHRQQHSDWIYTISSTATTASEDSGENDHLIEDGHTENTEQQMETVAKTQSSPAGQCIQYIITFSLLKY
jgi:hypothetical protein